MAHPVPTKAFLQPSPEAAMLSWPSAETHPPPLVPPFLLAQNLRPKDIAGNDIMKLQIRAECEGKYYLGVCLGGAS